MKPNLLLCALCTNQADLFCPADSALLCRRCDHRVHAANFLVARHLRHLICPNCNSVSDNLVSGTQTPQNTSLCGSCRSCTNKTEKSSGASGTTSSSSSLNSVSSCESFSTTVGGTGKKRKPKKIGSGCGRKTEAEAIFVNWCRILGLNSNSVVPLACSALKFCLERLTVLPYRVSLAASFWYGFKLYGDRSSVVTWQNLREVEGLTGVPNKLIVAVEMRLARTITIRKVNIDLEEGWAES